jgi:hypothetical protein
MYFYSIDYQNQTFVTFFLSQPACRQTGKSNQTCLPTGRKDKAKPNAPLVLPAHASLYTT